MADKVAEHTPGEWKAKSAQPDGEYFTADIIAQDVHSKLDVLPGQAAGRTAGEAEANAQLMAASPDLLKALKRIAAESYEAVPNRVLNAEINSIAREAIEAATQC